METANESLENNPKALVIKEYEVNGRKLAVLKASPTRLEGKQKSEQLLFIEGHNPRPGKDDDQVKTGFDISVLADKMGCDVYSILRLSEGRDSTQLATAEDLPNGVAFTQLHQAKASEIIGAMEKLQEDGEISQEHLDVMGFSDGGMVTLAILAQQPALFNRFVIANTPGLENISTGKAYMRGLHGLGHLFGYRLRQKFDSNYRSQQKLKFQRKEGDGYSASSYLGKPRIETHAVAKTRNLLRLLPTILTKNPQLEGLIVSTESDSISPATRVENELTQVLQGDKHISVARTGWKTHTMGYSSVERSEKLGELAQFMKQLRKKKTE